MPRSFLAVLALSLCPAAWSQQYSITTIAGTSIPGSSPSGFADGAATTAAQLDLPGALWVTSKGDVYIADGLNQRARLLSGGNVTTIAGNGSSGFSGDNGPATSAELNDPLGIAVDSSGNVFIADTANNVVRKVSSGTITTYAGNNSYPAGPVPTGDFGAATNASMNAPVGLALDSAGNLYICDANNHAVRKVTASTGIITTVVGTTSITANALNHPAGIALDAAGNIYIADSGVSKIYKYTLTTGKITTVAGIGGASGFSGDGGLATFAKLGDPQGVALDAAGNIYIADTVNNRIRKVTTDGIISTIAGSGRQPGYSGDGGPATSAQLYGPGGLFVDPSGNIYVADTHNSVIRLLQPTGYPTVNQGGVGNAASYRTTISPGALATVFGTGFGMATGQPLGNPLPINYGGVGVTVNGKAANLYYVSPGQINFQVPWETSVGTANVAVTLSGGASNTVSVPVVSAGPGLFTLSNGDAIVQNAPSYSLNTQSNPAPAGSTIVAYLTGSGPVSPAMTDGVPTPNSLVQSTLPWAATIGSSQAQVSFIGLTPGFVGLVQANIVVPPTMAAGTYPLVVSIGGEASNAGNVYVK